VIISFGYILHCVCFNLYCGGFILYCNVCVCVCVCVCRFLMCGCFGNVYTLLWLRFFLPWLRFFRAFILGCKANARVKLAKTGHGPHSSKLVFICVVLLLFVLFYIFIVCKCVLYYCHRVTTQLQLTNISISILFTRIQGVPGVKFTTSGFKSRADSESKISYTHGSNLQRFRSYEFLNYSK